MQLGRSILCAGVTLLLAVPASARQRGAELEARITEVLNGVHRPVDVLRARDELAALGAPSVEPIFARLQADPSAGAPELDANRTAALHAALAQLPRERVLALLESVARSGADEPRAVALDCVAHFGTADELELALALGTPAGAELPAPELSDALERALGSILARESRALGVLAGLYPRAQPAARTAITGAIGSAGGEQGLSALAALLGKVDGESDALLLDALGGLASRIGPCQDAFVAHRVRDYLGNVDHRLVVLACLASAKLRDHQAIPALVELLADADDNLRTQARTSLTSLTGLTFAASPKPWSEWLERSQAWWDERSEPCRTQLASGTPAEAASALREIAEQRLDLDRIAQLLEAGLERTEPDILVKLCQTLGSIPDLAASDMLAELASNPVPAVAEQARAELRRHPRAHPTAPRATRSLPHRSTTP